MKKINIEIDYEYWMITNKPIYKRFIRYLIPFYNDSTKDDSLYQLKRIKNSEHFDYLKSLMSGIIEKMSTRINILSDNFNHYDWKINIYFKTKKGKNIENEAISFDIELAPLNNKDIPSFKYDSTQKSKINNFYFQNTSEYKNYVDSIRNDDISFYTKIYHQNEKRKKRENKHYKNHFLFIENFYEFNKEMESKNLSILRNYDDIFVIYFTIKIQDDITWSLTLNPLSNIVHQSDFYSLEESSYKSLLTAMLNTYFMGDMQEYIDVINDDNVYDVLENIKMMKY